MPTSISPLADVDSRAQLGANVTVGPFCRIGPHVQLGDDCVLDSNVAIVGRTIVGARNRFWPQAVIGAEPQDLSYVDLDTRLEIGDDNQFREGVTVHRGADKEDGVTRIGNRNLLMANCHVAHNCRLYDNVILVNGVLLGGHVHVHEGAIVSGNSAVHHFATLGTLSFVGGCGRVTRDVPPYMLCVGNENPTIKTINVVGMQRAGISGETIRLIRRTHRLMFREHKPLDVVRRALLAELDGVFPFELTTLLSFLERQAQGRVGRAREAVRNQTDSPEDPLPADEHRRAA